MLVDYDARWPLLFDEIAASLRRIGNDTWVIEHIGSTAVPGIKAKPMIDLAVRLSNESDFDRHRPALEQAGWRVGSRVRTHRVMVFEEDGVRTRIAHFFHAEQWGAVNQRILRDWLIAHPVDARRYEQAKIAADEDARHGRGSYNAGKTTIIQEIVDRARAARGLASVSVYDK